MFKKSKNNQILRNPANLEFDRELDITLNALSAPSSEVYLRRISHFIDSFSESTPRVPPIRRRVMHILHGSKFKI
jgi:hypothetical protein